MQDLYHILLPVLCGEAFGEFARRFVLILSLAGKRYRHILRAHSEHHLAFGHRKALGNGLYCGLTAVGCGIFLYEFVYGLSLGLHRARYLYAAVVAHKALYFAGYHRHGVCGKAHAVTFVEAVYGFKKAHPRKLEQIVVLHPLAEVAADNRLHKIAVFGEQFFLGGGVARFGTRDKLVGLFYIKHSPLPGQSV